jgi:hypothetical protein
VTGVYGWNTGEGGTHYHRITEPLRVAAERGIVTGTGTRLGESELERFDTVIAYELTQPAASEQWERLAKRGDTRMVFDIDDGMWDADWPAFRRYYTPAVVERMFRNASIAHVVTTSSWVIAEKMREYNANVHFAPYTMPAWLLDIVQTGPSRPRRSMGFAGSASHEQDMDDAMKRTMLGFLAGNPGWDWHFWGKEAHEVSGWPRGRVHTYPWTDVRQRYFRSLMMDACMAPLRPTLFNRCKSALRFIENSALGICSIIQELDPYFGYLVHGENGWFVGPNGFPDWSTALNEVARDPIGRARVAASARLDAASWTTEAQFDHWLTAWNSV